MSIICPLLSKPASRRFEDSSTRMSRISEASSMMVVRIFPPEGITCAGTGGTTIDTTDDAAAVGMVAISGRRLLVVGGKRMMQCAFTPPRPVLDTETTASAERGTPSAAILTGSPELINGLMASKDCSGGMKPC